MWVFIAFLTLIFLLILNYLIIDVILLLNNSNIISKIGQNFFATMEKSASKNLAHMIYFSSSCFSVFLFFSLLVYACVCVHSLLAFFSRKFFSYLKTLSFSVVLVYLFFQITIQRKKLVKKYLIAA
jgi:hypothetical protein